MAHEKHESGISKAAAMTTHRGHLEDLHPDIQSHLKASGPEMQSDNAQNEKPAEIKGGPVVDPRAEEDKD